MQKKYYRDFSDFLAARFPGIKVQKISINAGFTCPNRDGTKGTGGCTYCNNQTFNPEYCKPSKSIKQQLTDGKQFFGKKYPEMKYLAYFQAYTSTYAEQSALQSMYEEALSCSDVVGLIIGTRPDCMPDELLRYLTSLSKRTFVMVEYGAETADNATLRLINRGHTWEDTVDAVRRTHAAGIHCGLHMILGLPYETEAMMLDSVRRLSALPVDTVKFHQLQIVRGTMMHRQLLNGQISVVNWSVDEYIDLCIRIIRLTPQTISIERFVSQSPDSLLVSPRWGLKNYQFVNRLQLACEKAGLQLI